MKRRVRFRAMAAHFPCDDGSLIHSDLSSYEAMEKVGVCLPSACPAASKWAFLDKQLRK